MLFWPFWTSRTCSFVKQFLFLSNSAVSNKSETESSYFSIFVLWKVTYCRCHVYLHTSRVSILPVLLLFKLRHKTSVPGKIRGQEKVTLSLVTALWLTTEGTDHVLASHTSPRIPKCTCYEMTSCERWWMWCYYRTELEIQRSMLLCETSFQQSKKKKKRLKCFCQIVWEIFKKECQKSKPLMKIICIY